MHPDRAADFDCDAVQFGVAGDAEPSVFSLVWSITWVLRDGEAGMSSRITGNRLAIALAAVAIVFFAREARAQVLYDWIDSGGGSYHTAANWFPGAGAPPGPNDGAAFGLPAAYTVSFFIQPFSLIPVKVSDIYVVNGDVTFDQSNGSNSASIGRYR